MSTPRSAILLPKSLAPLTVSNYIKLGANLSGRDKLMRLLQYGSRAIVYHLGEKTESGKKLQLLQKALGLHRKAFKLGMFLDEAQKFIESLTDSKMTELDRFLTLVQRLAMTFFVIYDNLLYLTEIKFTDAFDKATIKMKSYQFRLVAAIASTISIFLSLSKQQDAVDVLASSSSTVDQDKLTKAREKQGLNVWKTIKNVCDVLTYANSAELIAKYYGKGMDDGTVGVIGAISSYAGLVEIWATKISTKE
jgi:peroxin-11B